MRRFLLPIPFLSLVPLAVKAQGSLAVFSTTPVTNGDAAVYSGSSGTLITDAGYPLASMAFQSSGSVNILGGTASLGFLGGPSTFTLTTAAPSLVNYSPNVTTSTSPLLTSGEISPFSFVVNDQASISTTTANTAMWALESRLNLNSSLVTGNRAAGEFEAFLTSPTGNGPAHHSGTYSAVSAGSTIESNDGGIPEPGDSSRWNGSTENNLFSSISTGTGTAAAFSELTSLEIDTAISASNTLGAYRKLGLIIALGTGDTTRGVGEDAALEFGGNASTSWKDLIEIGSFGGWPAASDSSLLTIGRDPLQGTTEVFPAAWGIDFRPATFTDGFLASNGFYVDPSGNVAVNQLVGGPINSAAVVTNGGGTYLGGTYYPGGSAITGCASYTTSSTPSLSVTASLGGATGSLAVSGWQPLGSSIAVDTSLEGAGNQIGDILTIPGTQTKVQVTGTLSGGVTSVSVTSTGFTPLFPSSSANPWPAVSNNGTASPPSFCIGAFQIGSVAVISPAFGYAAAPAVSITAPGVTSPGSISATIGPTTVNVDTALNVTGGTIEVGGTKVVGTQATGWGIVSGPTSRGVFNTGSTTSVAQIAATLGALIDDLQSHGLISN